MTDLPPPQWPPPQGPPAQWPPPQWPPPDPPLQHPSASDPYPPASYPPAGVPLQPYPSGPPASALKVDGFAITSLVFGIVGGWLFSIGFGMAALVRIGKGKRRGKGLAIAGLCLSVVWIVGLVLAVSLGAGGPRGPDRDAAGHVTKAGQVAPVALRTGDCVRLPADMTEELTALAVVPCGQPHNSEVFTRVPATDVDFYPGDDAVSQGSLDRCRDAANSYLGEAGAGLSIVALYPDEVKWETVTKQSSCLLVDDVADFTGEIRDHA